ncbi:hypothetical protein [Microcoleus sp. PH2017_21_RUC_O_A]|uniref:hypothetical protein n=1 Tax=Microcoleus sp. PH2017_21_RUC_O_A TaxID=2798832 RepID=UPI0025EC64FE|nr:hypothetical protein [Microcoleus sp. PH2017_21_RUC_O_A]
MTIVVTCWFIFETLELILFFNFYRNRYADFLYQILKIGVSFLFIVLCIFSLLTSHLSDNVDRRMLIKIALLVTVISWFIFESIIFYKLKIYRERHTVFRSQIVKIGDIFLWILLGIFLTLILPNSVNSYKIFFIIIATALLVRWVTLEVIIIYKLYRHRDASLRTQILEFSFSCLFILLCIFYLPNFYLPKEDWLPSLSPSAQSEISKIFEILPKGLFVYSCSKEMTVGIAENCTARIANDKYLSNFRKAINKGLNFQNIEEIKLQYVSSRMSVTLTGESFAIKLKGNGEEQVIEDKSFSSWQWDVTPREAGMQKLDFVVSVILDVPGYEKLPPKRFEANTIQVSVKVNPSFSIKNFIEKEWKYLTAIIVVVLVYFTVIGFITKKRDAIMVNKGDTYNGDTYNISGQAAGVGKYASSHKNTFVQSEQKVTLAEAAAEIQKLLKQLEIDNPTATKDEKIAYVNDATNPNIKKRAIAALKAGGETAIEEFLANPYVNVGKAIIKGWIQAE